VVAKNAGWVGIHSELHEKCASFFYERKKTPVFWAQLNPIPNMESGALRSGRDAIS
jgi:hypothetical protein